MARIRSLKPEFWDDRKLARATSRDARMLYMGLWNQADEHSRLNGDLVWLKGRIFPYDADIGTDRIAALLDELEAAGRVRRYEVDGDPFVFLPKLAQHQRLEPKVESRLPAPPDQRADAQPSESHADKSAPDADESALLYVAGSRGHGAGGARAGRDADPPRSTCAKHPHGTEDACGPCGSARKRRAEWDAAEPERKRRAIAERKAAIKACDACDADGWLINDAGEPSAFQCDHHRRTA